MIHHADCVESCECPYCTGRRSLEEEYALPEPGDLHVEKCGPVALVRRIREIADDCLGLQPVDADPIALLDELARTWHEHRIARLNAEAETVRVARDLRHCVEIAGEESCAGMAVENHRLREEIAQLRGRSNSFPLDFYRKPDS